jgi:hypothetical protein
VLFAVICFRSEWTTKLEAAVETFRESDATAHRRAVEAAAAAAIG